MSTCSPQKQEFEQIADPTSASFCTRTLVPLYLKLALTNFSTLTILSIFQANLIDNFANTVGNEACLHIIHVAEQS